LATTLVVTEKPDAALHIAEALSENESPKKILVEGVPFFEVHANARRILVCSALGHLYAVAAKEDRGQSEYPVWNFIWKPKHLVQRAQERQRNWIQAITKVSGEADRFIDACDFDLEGSLIGYMVLKYACQGADKEAQRMKFSTLTETELRDAYAHALPKLNFPSVFAGMCRHEVDWLFGINLSRALTQSALKASGRYATLSTGRVQGPTLRFLVERQQEIETFVPIPYWALRVKMEVDGRTVAADYEDDKLEKKVDAQEVVHACAGKSGLIETLDSSDYELAPPTPFDLSSLQSEAFRHFRLSPRISLSIAERLYLDQLISYPRTSSQKLPPSIGYERIVRSLGQLDDYKADAAHLLGLERLMPNEGKKDDPAHPAVYPTGTLPRRQLDDRERRLFDLVVRRFLASFSRTAVKRSSKATAKVGNHRFLLRGSRLIEKGWTTTYKPYARFEDIILPPIRIGQSVVVREIQSEQKFTQPPPHYNPSSLLRKMEDSEIGTKATRADIIETLYKRGYITGQQINSTPLASRIIEILDKHCPKILDVAFTRELEGKIEEIERGSETREHVVLQTVDYLKPIIEVLKVREREIGQELTTVLAEMREESTALITPCPQCGSRLKIAKNPRTRKRFIGCSGRWTNNCNYSLPLPQLGTLGLLEKSCPDCGFQLIQVKSRGRRPLISCCRCYAQRVVPQSSTRRVAAPPKRE
jgi:DNA topoisomerase-1